jgi:rhodanese-related sulfurtransferase
MEEQTFYYKEKLQFETDSIDLAEALKINPDIVIIDVRPGDSFKQEHIPGAINFPYKEICGETITKLDQGKLYVAYSDGTGSQDATKAAFHLSRLGYQVKELVGGLEWWKRYGYETIGSKIKKEVTSLGYYQ